MYTADVCENNIHTRTVLGKLYMSVNRYVNNMGFQSLIVLALASHLSISTTASQGANCNTSCTYTYLHKSGVQDADCNKRGLTSVPQGCSPSMKTMDLRENKLKSLGPRSFRGYVQLDTLAMEFNQISNITTGAFEGCVSLDIVYLQHNLLAVVGEGAFDGATALNGLYLNENDIVSLHAYAFRDLGNLEYLDIGSNDLRDLPQRIFDNLVRLKYLNLENNNLQSVDGTLFIHLVNLEKLILSRNLIVSITGFPMLPNLRTLDLFDNDLRDISNVADKISNLEIFYLGENDNVICTCSINPVCEWMKNHRLDRDEHASKADVACREPPSLRGQMLHSLSNSSLCSTQTTGSALPWSTFKGSNPTKKPNGLAITQTPAIQEDEGPSSQGVASNEHLQPQAISIYVAVGTGCLIVILLTIIILIKCLNYTTRKHQQRQPVTQQEQRHPQPRQGNRDTPMMRITINRSSQDDDGAYEFVQPNLHNSPTNDSAFGSQTDLAEVTEDAQAWQGTCMIHQAAADGPESSFQSYPTYMSLDDWDATHPLPPLDISTDADFPTLAQEQHATNPFLRPMPHDQAVPTTEGPSDQMHSTSYVPHNIFSKLPVDNIRNHMRPPILTNGHQLHPDPAGKLPQSLHYTPKHSTPYVPHSFVHQANLTLGQTPDQTPELTPEHLSLCKSNPFGKSESTNPFISYA